MEKDLVSIYESNYLRGNLVQEKKKPDFRDFDEDGDIDESMKKALKDKENGHSDDEDEDEDKDKKPYGEAVKRKIKNAKKSKKSMKNKSKKPNPGELYNDSFKRSGNIFDQILREMDEMDKMNGGNFGASPMGDNVFNADDQMNSGEEESFTLSELRAMSLGEIANLLAEGEDEGEEYGEEYGEEMEDGVPTESYGFTGGEGNYKGNQGIYNGKAQRGKPTTFVKANGDMDFGDADTGYDPDDTEGSEGSYHGDQGDYDGKAKKQAPSSHVKANGDADFSKANTGIKTSSGKKPKNYF
jgi:hypothetical protein